MGSYAAGFLMKPFGVTPALKITGMAACIRGFIKYKACAAVPAF